MYVQLVLLILANVFFGIAPIFLRDLQDVSPFTISFIRFFEAMLVETLLLLLLAANLQRRYKKLGYEIKYTALLRRGFKQYFSHKNPYFFKDGRQWSYIATLGVLIVTLHVPTFILSFTLAGVVWGSIFIYALTILGITVTNWLTKTEDIDWLKGIYLILLVLSIVTTALAYQTLVPGAMNPSTVLIMLLSTVVYIAFLILINRDASTHMPLFKHPLPLACATPENRDKVVLFWAVQKLWGIHLAGVIFIFPLTGLLALLAPDTVLGSISAQFLVTDLPALGALVVQPDVIVLVLLCTCVPYLCIVLSSSQWPTRKALSHSEWAGMLSLVPPILALYIGLFWWGEALNLDYVILTTVLLGLCIVVRYFSENSTTRRVIFLVELENGSAAQTQAKIRRLRELVELNYLTGKNSIMFRVIIRSLQRLNEISKIVNDLPGILHVSYYVEEPVY